ncbi:MAG: S-layer protein [Theionarchaea archaeon]|nr:S-layer protein [Theionarchaea archaeon]MBU7039039.1 S-layer protein [Theionarchaea archaeon]
MAECQGILPPKGFFVSDLQPEAIIVVGDAACAEDVISATMLATRMADMTAQARTRITEVVTSETEHIALDMIPFEWADYHVLFDLTEDTLWHYDYRLEDLRDTIPGGFIPTWGRTWASRTTPINLLGDYYSMLEIRQYDGYSWWYLFHGIPRNFEHQCIKRGESRRYGKYLVTVLDVDVDELEVTIALTSDTMDARIILPVYCKDCKHVVGELFCNATDPMPPLEAADTLQNEYPGFFVNLKYFVGGPLSIPEGVARAQWYWNATIPATPDTYIDGEFNVPTPQADYYLEFLRAFSASTRKGVPLRVYTAGFLSDEKGEVNVFLSSDYSFDSLAVTLVLFERRVECSGTTYFNVVRMISHPVYLSMREGSTFEYSYTFSIPPTISNPAPETVGAVVFVQDTVTRKIYQADVLDLKEKRNVFEIDIDADFDGEAKEVEFAIECTKIPFVGVQGNAWARFNIYWLQDYGVVFPMCCGTPFFENETASWDLEIEKRGTLGYIQVNVCDPFDIHCLEPGDVLYGPRHLTRIEVIEVTDTYVEFFFQFMRVSEMDVGKERVVEPSSLIYLAHDVTGEEVECKNLVLVGGPGVNSYTRKLVDSGVSQVLWNVSSGEWELIKDAFGYGKDVLIVAGKDREATKFAAHKLYYALEMYER